MKKSTRNLFGALSLLSAGAIALAACTPTGQVDPGALATAQAVAAAAQTQAAASGVDLQAAQQTAQAALAQGQDALANAQATAQAVADQAAAPAESYTTPHPILGDIRVRQAIAYCTDRPALIQSVYSLLDAEQQAALAMHTFIPRDHWAYAGDENVTVYEFSPEKGIALLEEAGWTASEEGAIRTNADGNELALKFTTTNATFRQTWAAVFEQQMAACGIRILRLHAPASWWFGDTTGIARRDYELGAFAWVGQADPGGTSLYACNQIPKPENNWEGQNAMGWCNEAASQAIIKANNTLIREERIEAYKIAQQEFAKDMISLPLFNRTNVYAINPNLTGFEPAPGESYYMHNIENWELPGSDTIVIGFTQEPASLFTQNEDAFVAQAAASVVGGFLTTGLNYDFQAKLQKELSTLESGMAENADVEVAAGDMVYNLDGDVVELAAGVKVTNAAGEVVEYSGEGTVTMKQLTVVYEVVDGLKWSDGTAVSAADWQLGYDIRCNPESGATSMTICDQTAEFVAADNGYTVTYQPGVQSPTYFLMPYGAYPAHQETSDGRMLKDVPAAEFATLPEVAEMPLGFGPYVITNWEKGVKMEFEANPNYVGGAPKTAKIVISFISPDNAEAQLLGGQVDVLGNETLTALTETLAAAAAEGKTVVIVDPSATWEHIDMQLFVK
ncbi:MAG TPA: ABC transporter substrate-binding protein [Anaerolineales bacterium]|nr:ABC transporter substrate-binding protein [Anaerolineales bacterium]